jgi:hypothetical protein
MGSSLDIDTALDWRGRTVLDRDGRKVGRLEEIYLDRESERPAWATLHTGLFGRHRTFVPLAEATRVGDDLQVPWTSDQIKDAPRADPDVTLAADEEDRLYEHYALSGADRSAAHHDVSERNEDDGVAGEPGDRAGGPDPAAGEGPSVIRSEEELRVGTQVVPSRLRLKKYVVTEEQVVPVRREQVRVERVPVDGEGEPEVLFDTADEDERR